MKSTKRILSLMLASVLLLTATSCGKKEDPAPNAPEDPAPSTTVEDNKGDVGTVDKTVTYAETFTIACHADLDAADPYASNSSLMKIFTNMTFDQGVNNNPDTGETEPVLCESWRDVNGDGLTWEFKLREGVKFHNGADFTAEDMKFTWEYAMPGAGNVINANANSAYVDSIEVIDAHTVQYNLKSAMFDWPAYMDSKIYSKTAFDTMEAAEAAVIGTGPYMYDKSKHNTGISFTAERFEDYWRGTEDYASKYITYKVLPDADTRVAALQGGEVDMIYDMTAAYYNVLKSDPNLNVLTRMGSNSYYMGYNLRNKDMQNLNVRKALSMAISRENIESIALFDGIGGVANYNFCIPTGAGYNADAKVAGYDPETAMAMLKEAGCENMKLTLGHTSSTKAIAEVVQAELGAIGIEVTLRQVDSTNWTSFKRTNEFDLFTDYAGYQGPLLFNFHRFMHSEGALNFIDHFSDEYDSLENDVLTAGSYDKMVEKFKELQVYAAENYPGLTPLCIGTQIAATAKNVEGVTLAPGTTIMNFSTARKIA